MPTSVSVITGVKWISGDVHYVVQPYRRRLRVVAMLDIVEATAMCILCAVQSTYVGIAKEFQLDYLSFWQTLFLMMLYGTFSFSINLVQIYGAYQLIKNTRVSRNPANCIKSAILWMRICGFLSITLVLKGIIFIFNIYAIRDNILKIFWLLNISAVVFEVFLRAIGCHCCRVFLERLPVIRTPRITSLYEHIVTFS